MVIKNPGVYEVFNCTITVSISRVEPQYIKWMVCGKRKKQLTHNFKTHLKKSAASQLNSDEAN